MSGEAAAGRSGAAGAGSTDSADSADSAAGLPGWRHVYSGKVRDLYEPGVATDLAGPPPLANAADPADPSLLLVVASDRISAFDHVLEPPIAGKGAVLTALSRWWFEQLEHVGVRNHLVEAGTSAPPIPADIADRAMLTRRLEMHPIECVVRGALTGSGFAEYQATGAVCGITLPAGLRDGDLLDEPIYTPAYKAPLGEHDENITFERTAELVGGDAAVALRDTSLKIFARARELAARRGVILADTKFEFGWDPSRDGSTPADLVLADEVLTSDSSRYWDAETYRAGGPDRLASFDKQIVRNWLAAHWDKTGTPPELPNDVVRRTLARYRELYDRLTS